MRRALLCSFAALWSLPALGQNITCPTRPPGDSTNACASTQFVQQSGAGSAISSLTGPVTATGPGAAATTITAGAVTAGNLASGAASTNVGALGGVLTGTLPNPGMTAGAAATNIGSLGGVLTGTLPNPGLGSAVVTGTNIASATVANSNLANMAAATLKCRVTGNGTGAPQDCNYPIINITDAPYSADPTGVSDSTTAIQNAINALPATGGDIVGPCGTYKVSTTLALGNGTSSTASTTYGMVFRGVGNSRTGPDFPGFNTAPCVKISWAGTGGGGVFSVNGPLQTWGIQNVFIECNTVTASVGIKVISAQFGDSRNLTLNNCAADGILSTTVPPFGSFTNVDSFHNDWYGIVVQMPNVASVHGIFLTGSGNAVGDTDVNSFHDVWIALPLTGNPVAQGLTLQVADTNYFYNLHLSGPAGNTNAQCIAFDYTVLSGFPSGHELFGVDPVCGGGAAQYTSTTPGSGALPNLIVPAVANGGLCPTLTNIACYSPREFTLSAGGNDPILRTYVDTGGHFGYKGAITTLTAGCNGAGSSVASGSNDHVGTIGTQTANATSCTINFANTWQTNAPRCVVSNNSNVAALAGNPSTTQLVVSFASAPAFFFTYMCFAFGN